MNKNFFVTLIDKLALVVVTLSLLVGSFLLPASTFLLISPTGNLVSNCCLGIGVGFFGMALAVRSFERVADR